MAKSISGDVDFVIPITETQSTNQICSNEMNVHKSQQRNERALSKAKLLTSIPNDELFLVIDNKTDYNGYDDNASSCSSVHVEYRQYYLNKKLDLAIASSKATANAMNTTKIECNNMTSKRKSIPRKLEFDAIRKNNFNKRLIKYLSENIHHRYGNRSTALNTDQLSNDKMNAIQCEIDQIIVELYELIAHEEDLMKILSQKCERYRNQNNKYMTKLRLELCVDEVQHNLDVYAKEIIDNELKLYQIQNDIHQKCGILFNLQRMLGNNDVDIATAIQNQSEIIFENLSKHDNSTFEDSGTFVDSMTNKSFII